MKKGLILLCCLLYFSEISSQNLVVNGGFENFLNCPTTYTTSVQCPPSNPILYNGVCEISPWFIPQTGSGTPDYYNSCSIDMGVPANITGNQAAHSGQAYVGFAAWVDNEEYKEYITSQLTSPLIAGQQYVVSFFISLSEYSQYSVNNVGLYLSSSIPSGGGIFNGPSQLDGNGLFLSDLGYTAQVVTTNIIDNYDDWIEVCQIYTAIGGEEYVTIGNFFQSSSFTSSNFQLLNPLAAANGAYFYMDDVSVIPYSPMLGSVVDTSSCMNQLTLAASSGNSFLWNTGEITQTIDVTADGKYWVEISSSCFNYTDTFNVILNSFNPSLGSDTTICEGSSISLGVAPNLGSYLWTPTGETTNEIIISPTTTTVYQLTITGLCGSVTLEKVVDVSQAPVVDAGPDLIVCEGQEITLNGSGANQYLWSNNVINGVPFLPFNMITYYVLTGINQFECQGYDTVNVIILSGPRADFLDFSITPPNFEVNLTNLSANATSYTWSFNDIDTSNLEHPSYIFMDNGSDYYEVTLVAYNNNGCIDSITKRIQIERKEELIYYVPNTFTPDGNKFNNVFQPVFFSGLNPQEYQLRIYNRWGEILFESHNHEVGWDGTYGNKLGLVQEGTYVWLIDFTTTNGEKINLTGHITLLK